MEDIVIEDKYLKEYYNLSKEELQKCKALSSSEESFVFTARYKHRDRERQKVRGVRAIQSHPLVFVLSARVRFKDEPVAIYGSIRANYWRRGDFKIVHELFEHKEDDARLVGTGGDLALKGPYYSSTIDHGCIPLRSIDVELELFDGTGSNFAKKHFQLDIEIDDDGYEVVKSESISCEKGDGDLILRYIVIPFGVSCCITISVFYRHSKGEDNYSFDVSGRIVAKYGNTYGKYSSEECILFDRREFESEPEPESEQEECGSGFLSLDLSRPWVALPAYSSLVVDMDLTVAGTDRRKIVKDAVELFPQQGGASNDSVVLDDYIITVEGAWFPPDYHWPHHPSENVDTQTEEENIEEIDIEGKDNNVDTQSEDEIDTEGDTQPEGEIEGENRNANAQSEEEIEGEDDNVAHPEEEIKEEGENLDTRPEEESEEEIEGENENADAQPEEIISQPEESEEEFHKDESLDDDFDSGSSSNASSQCQPSPFHAVEIFSVFIGREKPLASQVYGSIEVISDSEIIRSIFQSDDKDALTLSKDMKFIPVLDGFQVVRNLAPLEIKIDIKDVEMSFAIKGYGDWETHILNDALSYERQLCSLVRGKHGFAAVHYSIFSEAVEANIKVILNFKMGSVDINYSRVCGSLIVQYSRFEYSSKYKKDCYRSVLFKRDEDDSVQVGVDCTIPLGRSRIVVPSYSYLVLNVDLSFGDFADKLSRAVKIEIDESVKTVESNDCSLDVKLEWQKIK